MKNLILSLAFVFTFNLFAEIGVSDDFIKRFSSLPSYTNVDISPDGKMISVLTKMSDNKKGLSIFNADDLSLINTITLTKEEEIGSYYWVNNERLLISISYYNSWGRGSRGEFFAINFDSSKPAYVFGLRSRQTSARSKAVDKFSYGYVENILEDDDKHVLLSVNTFGQENNGGFCNCYKIECLQWPAKKIRQITFSRG